MFSPTNIDEVSVKVTNLKLAKENMDLRTCQGGHKSLRSGRKAKGRVRR